MPNSNARPCGVLPTFPRIHIRQSFPQLLNDEVCPIELLWCIDFSEKNPKRKTELAFSILRAAARLCQCAMCNVQHLGPRRSAYIGFGHERGVCLNYQYMHFANICNRLCAFIVRENACKCIQWFIRIHVYIKNIECSCRSCCRTTPNRLNRQNSRI